ncbi:MAG: ferredoxin reductase [Mycobacteriaceae bacterium]
MALRFWIHKSVAGVSAPRQPLLVLLRRVVARMTTPLLPDDYLHLVNPLWSSRQLRGKILKVITETNDSATLVIKPGWGFAFDYEPGQYIGIGVNVDGRLRWRSYSLTSVPQRKQRTISITVKAMPEGFLSSHLVGGVAPGTIVRLAAPQGNFVLPSPPPQKLLFITAGSGITPVISMLRTLDRRGHMPDVIHLHSVPTEKDVIFFDDLQQLSNKYKNFKIDFQLTRSAGKFNPADLDKKYPDWRQRHAWACGPAPMLASLEKYWLDAGIAAQLHTERFTAARADAIGQGGKVEFSRSAKSSVVDGATTLLEAGESAGVQMPFGCRMGICQTCVIPLLEGRVSDLRSGLEREAGEHIQACISVATGDCVLDI